MDGANELGTGIPPTTQEFKKIITQSHLPKVCIHAKSHSEFKAKAKSISKIPAKQCMMLLGDINWKFEYW